MPFFRSLFALLERCAAQIVQGRRARSGARLSSPSSWRPTTTRRPSEVRAGGLLEPPHIACRPLRALPRAPLPTARRAPHPRGPLRACADLLTRRRPFGRTTSSPLSSFDVIANHRAPSPLPCPRAACLLPRVQPALPPCLQTSCPAFSRRVCAELAGSTSCRSRLRVETELAERVLTELWLAEAASSLCSPRPPSAHTFGATPSEDDIGPTRFQASEAALVADHAWCE